MDRRDDFAAFVAARWAPLLRTAILLTGDRHAAEDLVQDALERAASRWGMISRAGSPEAYVRRILYTRSVDSWRWRRRQPDPIDVTDWLAAPVPDATTDHDTRMTIASALARLTPRQRAVLVLRYYDDLTEVEAARMLGVSPNTVKSQTRHALRRLRELAPELAAEFGRTEAT